MPEAGRPRGRPAAPRPRRAGRLCRVHRARDGGQAAHVRAAALDDRGGRPRVARLRGRQAREGGVGPHRQVRRVPCRPRRGAAREALWRGERARAVRGSRRQVRAGPGRGLVGPARRLGGPRRVHRPRRRRRGRVPAVRLGGEPVGGAPRLCGHELGRCAAAARPARPHDRGRAALRDGPRCGPAAGPLGCNRRVPGGRRLSRPQEARPRKGDTGRARRVGRRGRAGRQGHAGRHRGGPGDVGDDRRAGRPPRGRLGRPPGAVQGCRRGGLFGAGGRRRGRGRRRTFDGAACPHARGDALRPRRVRGDARPGPQEGRLCGAGRLRGASARRRAPAGRRRRPLVGDDPPGNVRALARRDRARQPPAARRLCRRVRKEARRPCRASRGKARPCHGQDKAGHRRGRPPGQPARQAARRRCRRVDGAAPRAVAQAARHAGAPPL